MPIAWWFCFVKKQYQTRGNGSKKPIPSEGAAGLGEGSLAFFATFQGL